MKQAIKWPVGAAIGVAGLLVLVGQGFATEAHHPNQAGGTESPADKPTGEGTKAGGYADRKNEMGQGGNMMRPGMMMQGGNMQREMMGQGMMRPDMMMQGGNMRRGKMSQGMMGQGMMSHGMMGHGMMMHGGRNYPLDMPIKPMKHLSVEDVRHALEHRLEWHGNKRLKVGTVKIEDDAIVAEIVTLDDSLVQRLKVDRHTGRVQHDS